MFDESPQDQRQREADQPIQPPDSPLLPNSHEDTDDRGTASTKDFSPLPASRANWPTIDGFTILREFPPGGMGIVYKAQQLKLNRVVALKMVLAGQYAGPEAISRFKVEAWSAARLQHPNIVQVYDLGDWNGQPYIVMEYVDGGHLGHRISRQPLTFRESAELIEKLARAVQYAHDSGVVHRDLKPGNVLLTRDGVPKIIDFGLAKRLRAEEGLTPVVTTEGAVLGTPGYLSPEQAAGNTKEIGPSADVYALGVMLYELLTGRRPFEGDSEMQILHKVVRDDPPSPAWLRPSIPRDLETVCLKCLEKDPRRRYSTAGELADDLRRHLNSEPIVARRISTTERSVRWVKRRPVTAILSALLIVALVGGIARAWNYLAYERKTVQYYANVVFKWDVAHGIGKISRADAQRRYVTWKLTRRGFNGPVDKFEMINGRGTLHADPILESAIHAADTDLGARHECLVEYERDVSGNVTRQVARDRAGRVVWKFNFANPSYGHYFDARDNPRAQSGSGAVGIRYVFSDDGSPLRQEYCDIHGNSQPRDDGSYGDENTYDDGGFPVTTTNLGPNGKPALHRDGYVTTRRRYDDIGNLTEVEYLDIDGNPTTSKYGFSRKTLSWNSDDNCVELALFDPAGHPAWHVNGYARMKRRYDEYGNVVEESYFGPDDRPARTTGGFSRATCDFDERGNMVACEYFGPDGELILIGGGYARFTARYDEFGNQTEIAYFGVDGRPALLRDGYARLVTKYNDQGYPIEIANYGVDGALTFDTDGHAKWTQKWDENGNNVETAYFGLDGKPAFHPDGNVKMVKSYDERGNQISQTFLGPDDKPVLTRLGYASTKVEFDEHGYPTETAYFGPDGEPALNQSGYHRTVATYDDRGNVTEESFFGVLGEPVLNTEQYARRVWVYDDRSGFETEVSYYDTTGNPTDEYSTVRKRYDDRGNLIESAFFDGEGNPVANKEGFARSITRYDRLGNLIEQAYFDAKNRPVLQKDGYARQTKRYDDRGHQVEEAYFGAAGEPTISRNGYAGWTAEYDQRGNAVKMRYFGLNREPILSDDGYAGYDWSYDARGNPIERRFLGTGGDLKRGLENYAVLKDRYDERGRLIEIASYDEFERPILQRSNVFRTVFDHNRLGHITRESYFGINGEPITHVAGYARSDREYDAFGHRIAERFFDTNGEPVANSNGVYAWTAKYDNRGNRVEERYTDADGSPMVSKDGTNGYIAKFDSRGNQIEATYVDTAGNVVANSQGFARWTAAYNDQNLFTETARFGVNGEPVDVSDEGWHRETMQYDQRSREIAAEFFAADGHRANTQDGYSRWVSEYNAAGHHVRRTYFNEMDEPVVTRVIVSKVTPDGVADRNGIRPGDVLVRYDGAEIPDMTTFIGLRAREFDLHQPHVLEYSRDGELFRVDGVYPGTLLLELRDRVVTAGQ